MQKIEKLKLKGELQVVLNKADGSQETHDFKNLVVDTGLNFTYVATFGAGTGTGAVTEAGLFNAASGGTMLCRTVFPVVNKQSGDSMTVSWVVTVS